MIYKDYSYSAVIDNFDFESIHDYMVETNWTWAIPYGDLEVPSIKRMKEVALQLLLDAMFNTSDLDIYWLQSGGFRAYCDNKTKELWLEFVKK